jgi:spore germination cell wall hydrolase CwlJ-like protein
MKTLFFTLYLLFFTINLYACNDLAETISAEAGGQGYKGMYFVACTIKNRALLYHKTPEQIINQKNQYYGRWAKNRHVIYEQVKKEADYLALNIMNLKDETNGAIYFRQLKEPRYSWHKIETLRYKNHIFYK